ncbi:MAG: agmatinase [Acidobacteria bacterium]|nr:agmatinase [Acidobacteriota bacterium]
MHVPLTGSPGRVTLLGVPWDASSSFLRGAAAAPPRIREALWSPSTNSWTEAGIDIARPGEVEDAGDLALPPDAAEARGAIEAAVRDLIEAGRRPLILGGDHSITYPVMAGLRGQYPGLTILHFDAHSDLYEEFEGDRYSHACPFARVLEDGLAARLIQVGIRCMTGHLRSQVERYGVEVYAADRWRAALPVVGALAGPVYVSLDIDVLEPMLAPGISHPEPGGLLVRDVLDVLAALPVPIVGADVVEYNPSQDLRDLTARVAAKFVKELVSRFAPL